MSYSIYPLKLFCKKKTVFISILTGVIINALAWIWMYFGITERAEEAVTHYTILFQVDRLGSFASLYFVPSVGIVILVVNLILGWLLYNYDVFLAELLVFCGTLLQLGILAAVSILVFLNA